MSIKIGIALVALCISASGHAQTKTSPEFSSIELSKDGFSNFNLICNYYTIDRNLANPASPVFVSDDPSLPEYIRFARALPSYYFLIKRKDSVMFSVLLNQKWVNASPEFSFMIFDPKTKRRVELPCKTWGEIAELRMAEMNALKFDTNSRIIDLPTGKIFEFDGVGYKVQPYFELKDEVILLSKQLVEKADAAQRYAEDYVRKESVGGKMDFNIALADEEKDRLYMVEKIALSKKDYILYLWAQAAHKVGIGSQKTAAILWEEIYRRKLSEPERKVLKLGYDSATDSD